jgi:uncharacterized membrane protein
MPPAVSEWSNLILRVTHVFVAILWIGQTYYFTKLDQRLTQEEKASRASAGTAQVWMVHSGGFFIAERQSTPKLLPSTLHWFRWEALMTWLSGFLLLGLLYYSDGLLLDSSVSSIGMGAGVAIGIGTLVAGWLVYDLLWTSPLGGSPVVAGTISYILVVALIYALTHLLSGRAAYIHIGALFGTIMSANVWAKILPASRNMLNAVKQGRQADMTLGSRAKARTIHNTYMTIPVIFIMVSNHFPGTYGSSYNWLILSVLILAGGIAAKLIYYRT